jgi:hypothetical protein
MENKKSTREVAKQLLIRQLADHNVNVKINGRQILIENAARSVSYSIHFCSTKEPIHAGGENGRLHLKWSIKESIEADIYALIDLSEKRTWLFNKEEIITLSQQHNNNTNHLYMFVDKMAPNPKNYSHYYVGEFNKWLLPNKIRSIF